MAPFASFAAGALLFGTASYAVFTTIREDTRYIQHRLVDIQRGLYGLSREDAEERAKRSANQSRLREARLANWKWELTEEVRKRKWDWNRRVESFAKCVNTSLLQ